MKEEHWNHEFELDFPVHALYETELQVANRENWPEHNIPEGCVAIIDAENKLLAYVPEVVGLVNPDRKLASLLCAILNAAGQWKLVDEDEPVHLTTNPVQIGHEANVQVNGRTLNQAQAMTLRVAITSYRAWLLDLSKTEPDEVRLKELYRDRLRELEQLLVVKSRG